MPHAAYFQNCKSCTNRVGRTPWSARDALVPPRTVPTFYKLREADGAPRTKGGPPHKSCRLSAVGKSKVAAPHVPQVHRDIMQA